MSLREKIQHFIQELETDGYFVIKKPFLVWSDTHKHRRVFTRYQFQKTTGSKERDINGGFLFTDIDGRVGFDVFKGSSKYGTHFKSKPLDHEKNGMTSDHEGFRMTFEPDLMGILNFLEVV